MILFSSFTLKGTDQPTSLPVLKGKRILVLYYSRSGDNYKVGYVDMGTGTLWGAYNMGATAPWELGDYYDWGETLPKGEYNEGNYTYFKRVIGKDISHTTYDPAQQKLGGDWRLPTKEEWHNLLYGTKHEWVKIGGHQGYLFIGKNGARLFFPTNGYKYGKEIFTPRRWLLLDVDLLKYRQCLRHLSPF